MQSKSINRFKSFCQSLNNLRQAKGRDQEDLFVLSGTVQLFNISFDLAWKVMKDLLLEYYGVVDYAVGSPRENLRKAYKVRLIENDIWMEMLTVRNNLMHDYDGNLALEYFGRIVNEFLGELELFEKKAGKLYRDDI